MGGICSTCGNKVGAGTGQRSLQGKDATDWVLQPGLNPSLLMSQVPQEAVRLWQGLPGWQTGVYFVPNLPALEL